MSDMLYLNKYDSIIFLLFRGLLYEKEDNILAVGDYIDDFRRCRRSICGCRR